MKDYTIHTSDEFEYRYKIFIDKFGNIINHYYVSNNKIIIEYYHNRGIMILGILELD